MRIVCSKTLFSLVPVSIPSSRATPASRSVKGQGNSCDRAVQCSYSIRAGICASSTQPATLSPKPNRRQGHRRRLPGLGPATARASPTAISSGAARYGQGANQIAGSVRTRAIADSIRPGQRSTTPPNSAAPIATIAAQQTQLAA